MALYHKRVDLSDGVLAVCAREEVVKKRIRVMLELCDGLEQYEYIGRLSDEILT